MKCANILNQHMLARLNIMFIGQLYTESVMGQEREVGLQSEDTAAKAGQSAIKLGVIDGDERLLGKVGLQSEDTAVKAMAKCNQAGGIAASDGDKQIKQDEEISIKQDAGQKAEQTDII